MTIRPRQQAHRKGDAMTNLDVFAKILSEVTGRPETIFRQIICSTLKTNNKWLEPAEPGLYEALQAEKAGILNWLISGASEAHEMMKEQAR